MTQGPTSPRPAMTFAQQAELLEYMHDKMSQESDGRHAITTTYLDQAQVDDLILTARRLRRMAPYEDQIKRLVTANDYS